MTLRTGEDTLIGNRRLWIALCGGIVLEEALDLSSDRLLNKIRCRVMMLCEFSSEYIINVFKYSHFRSGSVLRTLSPKCVIRKLFCPLFVNDNITVLLVRMGFVLCGEGSNGVLEGVIPLSGKTEKACSCAFCIRYQL